MNKESDSSIVIYEDKNGSIEFQADIKRDTIWASRIQVAQLFETTPQNISLHMVNIYAEGELEEDATRKKSFLVQKEGGRATKRPIDVYNLDAIIAVGYRVNSKKATQFRIWSTRILREYLVGGLYEAINLIESKDHAGKLKGKITIKLTKDLVPLK